LPGAQIAERWLTYRCSRRAAGQVWATQYANERRSRLSGKVSRTRFIVREIVRVLAVLAALSVATTLWFVASFFRAGGLRALLASGLLGVLTLVGWIVTLVIGPVAAVQLWKLRESGRRAGLLLFGYGLAYYVLGLFALRAPEASVWQIVAATTMFAVPFVVLLLPRTRAIFRVGSSE
jgi:hypothetical protein